MIRAFGVILTLALVAGSVMATAGSGWILGEAVHPDRAGTIVGPFTLGMLLAALAILIEGIRLTVSACGERVWRRSQFQGVAFAAPLWLACTGYCILMPLLALALVPLLPAGSHVLTVIAPAWAAVQIVTGLMPGVRWSSDPALAAGATHFTEQTAEPANGHPAASEAMQPTTLHAGPAHLVAESAASADDFFRFLSRLSELPAGSTLPSRGRIGTNHEILISQAGLAALVGRSKPTVRRWLHELERGARIVKRPMGKNTCILLSQHAHRHNGQAHLNGAAKNAA